MAPNPKAEHQLKTQGTRIQKEKKIRRETEEKMKILLESLREDYLEDLKDEYNELEEKYNKLIENHHIFKKEPPQDKEQIKNEIKKINKILKTYQNSQYLQSISTPDQQEAVSKSAPRKKPRKLTNRPVLTQRDLNTLNEEGLVNDIILQGILYNITKNMNSVLVLSTYLSTNIVKNKNTERLLGGENIFNYKEVFIPCHVGNHWILARYRPETENLDIYDSLQFVQTSRILGEKIGDWIRKEARCLNRHMNSTITLGIRNDFPRQTDATSCGIFLIHYVQEILERKGYCSIPNIQSLRIFWKNKMRRYMKND